MRAALLCCLLLLAALPARAQAVFDAIIARGTLRVGLTGDYKPFSFKDTAGTFTGLDVDMAENLAAAMGVKLEVVPTAWPNLMADLQSGKYDIGMGGISVTLPRSKTALFSIPVLRSGKTPIARCADKDRFQTLADIDKPGTRVIFNPGGTNERFARANLKQAEMVLFPSNATIFEELVAGRADVMITDAIETKVMQKQMPQLCAIHPDQPFDFAELAYLLPRDLVLKHFVDQWLHLSTETGDRAKMAAKYLE